MDAYLIPCSSWASAVGRTLFLLNGETTRRYSSTHCGGSGEAATAFWGVKDGKEGCLQMSFSHTWEEYV